MQERQWLRLGCPEESAGSSDSGAVLRALVHFKSIVDKYAVAGRSLLPRSEMPQMLDSVAKMHEPFAVARQPIFKESSVAVCGWLRPISLTVCYTSLGKSLGPTLDEQAEISVDEAELPGEEMEVDDAFVSKEQRAQH